MSSIKDVAKLAGVSVATVSRVINDKGKVKEETRDAIEQAMIQLSYHPNAMARSLVKNNRSKIIAVFFMSPYLPFFSELIFHIEEALSEKGYKLLLLTSYMDEIKEVVMVHKEKNDIFSEEDVVDFGGDYDGESDDMEWLMSFDIVR